jgi:hypothetical protein
LEAGALRVHARRRSHLRQRRRARIRRAPARTRDVPPTERRARRDLRATRADFMFGNLGSHDEAANVRRSNEGNRNRARGHLFACE